MEIIYQIRHYVLAMLMISVGFAMSFTVLLGPRNASYNDPLKALFYLVNSGIYGEVRTSLQ